jgi:GR25 family glycosyltransferase involved in LPS biosynthesis
MEYAGFFINLDRSPERRAEVEKQLQLLGLTQRYRRFAAANGNTLGVPNPKLLEGEIGCFISHYLVLKENLGAAAPLHVVEDDVLFSGYTEPAIKSLPPETLGHYDIIFTDIHIPLSNELLKRYKDSYDASVKREDDGHVVQVNFNIVDLADGNFAATSGMVISPGGVKKLHALYRTELERGAEQPVDLFLRRKVVTGEVKAGCIFPFVTSVRFGAALGTTLGTPGVRQQALAGQIARHAFFINANFDACLAYARENLPAPEDRQQEILTHVLGFTLDKHFSFR